MREIKCQALQAIVQFLPTYHPFLYAKIVSKTTIKYYALIFIVAAIVKQYRKKPTLAISELLFHLSLLKD